MDVLAALRQTRLFPPSVFLLLLAACASAPGGAASSSAPLQAGNNEQIVIMVGVDGLRPGSLRDWPEAAPAMNALADRGVRALGMVPVMPSKTFPNFYSIATGLHPEHTGITSNSPYSRAEGQVMARADHGESRWWGGEPIWATAEKQGARAAAMFWLGSEAEVAGVRPTYWSPYEQEKPFPERTRQVLDWLTMPEAARPRLITLYFHAVDSAAHVYGPGSPQERAAIEEVDAQVARLVAGVSALGLEDRVNIIVASDHGMALTPAGNVAYLDDYISFDDVFIPEFEGPDGASPNTALHLYTDEPEAIFGALAGVHPAFKVYRREHLPARWRMAHPDRTGEIVVVAEPGWLLFGRGLESEHESQGLGAHGYDRHHPAMLATFLADGPAFADGAVVEPFDNVEVYGLIAQILGLEPAETDGDLDHVRHLLAREE